MPTIGPTRHGSVSVRRVSRGYGDRRVLEAVDLEVPPGGIARVMGANGSGKTTLLRILAGVLEPDAGHVEIAGTRPGNGSSSFVPSGDRMLHWRLTGDQNLAFFARLRGVPESEVASHVRSCAGAVDAGDLLHRPVGECSMGQRRRLMLAVAFLGAPPVLLLDEPSADLDDIGRAAVDRSCHGWAEAGGVIVYATPNDTDEPSADLAWHLRDGTIEVAR